MTDKWTFSCGSRGRSGLPQPRSGCCCHFKMTRSPLTASYFITTHPPLTPAVPSPHPCAHESPIPAPALPTGSIHTALTARPRRVLAVFMLCLRGVYAAFTTRPRRVLAASTLPQRHPHPPRFCGGVILLLTAARPPLHHCRLAAPSSLLSMSPPGRAVAAAPHIAAVPAPPTYVQRHRPFLPPCPPRSWGTADERHGGRSKRLCPRFFVLPSSPSARCPLLFSPTRINSALHRIEASSATAPRLRLVALSNLPNCSCLSQLRSPRPSPALPAALRCATPMVRFLRQILPCPEARTGVPRTFWPNPGNFSVTWATPESSTHVTVTLGVKHEV